MSNLRELLHASAPAAGEPDLEAVRARASVLVLRQRLARSGAAALLVVSAGAGVIAATSEGEDPSTVIAESPEVPKDKSGIEAPDEIGAEASTEAEAAPGSGTARGGARAESGAEGAADGGVSAGSAVTVERNDAPPPTQSDPVPAPSQNDPAPSDSPPSSGAGAGGGGSIRFTDPAGDVRADPRVSSIARDSEGEPQLDVVAAALQSDGETLSVVTQVVDLKEGAPSGASGSAYRFSFDYEVGGTRYRVLVDIQRYNDSQFIRLEVSGSGTRTQDPCDGCTATFDVDDETVSGTVPLHVLKRTVRSIGGGVDTPGSASDPLVETLWIDSPNRAEDCEQPESFRSVCSSQGAVADTAEGQGAFVLR